MKNPLRHSATLLLASIAVLLLSSSAFALMPPHVKSTNVKDGVLEGSELILHGYSLKYTDLPKDLVITDANTKNKKVSFTHKLNCKWVGECDDDRPGSCQLKCVLRVTLDGVKHGARLRLRYLDETLAFRVVLKKK
jgi:hypothetical protein